MHPASRLLKFGTLFVSMKNLSNNYLGLEKSRWRSPLIWNHDLISYDTCLPVTKYSYNLFNVNKDLLTLNKYFFKTTELLTVKAERLGLRFKRYRWDFFVKYHYFSQLPVSVSFKIKHTHLLSTGSFINKLNIYLLY